MKVTKSKLRRIIQEELSNVLSENPTFDSWDDAIDYDREENPQSYWGGGDIIDGDLEGPDFSSGLDPENLQSVDPEMQNPFYDQNVEGEYQQFLDDKAAAKKMKGLKSSSLAMRKRVNQLRDEGEIDMATWRAARRALYKGKDGQRQAGRIIQSYRRSKNRSANIRGPQVGGYADLAMNPDMPLPE